MACGLNVACRATGSSLWSCRTLLVPASAIGLSSKKLHYGRRCGSCAHAPTASLPPALPLPQGYVMGLSLQLEGSRNPEVVPVPLPLLLHCTSSFPLPKNVMQLPDRGELYQGKELEAVLMLLPFLPTVTLTPLPSPAFRREKDGRG